MATMRRRDSASNMSEEASKESKETKEHSPKDKVEKPKIIDYSKKIPVVRETMGDEKISIKVSGQAHCEYVTISIVSHCF